ncbi:MAG TPA: MBL fold metallo-hydrolase [Thermoleophilaceae bacterium]|nr:MBL fold metallo-hydrolase [Thermoleophilaceae bacterium]
MSREIDVMHLGRDRVICAHELDGLIIDPGPESCMETLLSALDGQEPRALLLTHIHLDHAGASGALVRKFPGLTVYVHERGAPHLVDPSKLLKSATQLYGDDMDRLWGEVVPVPEENIRALSGGETVEGLQVEYTPGHASHHVTYFDEDSGDAYVGDTAGVRIPPCDFVMAPTPPPDIDLEKWNASLDLIESRSPQRLRLTHFGAHENVDEHIAQLRVRLAAWGEVAKTADQERYIQVVEAEVRASAGDDDTAESYFQAVPPDQAYLGLERYWTKKAEREAA